MTHDSVRVEFELAMPVYTSVVSSAAPVQAPGALVCPRVLFFGQLHYLPKFGGRPFGGRLLAGHAQPVDVHEVKEHLTIEANGERLTVQESRVDLDGDGPRDMTPQVAMPIRAFRRVGHENLYDVSPPRTESPAICLPAGDIGLAQLQKSNAGPDE